MRVDRPPTLARRLLDAALPPRPEYRELLADLDEEFLELSATEPRGRARRWYWSQAIRSIRPLVGIRLEGLGGRRHALACLVLVATFVGGSVVAEVLFERARATRPLRFMVDAAVLVVSTALAARFARGRGARDSLSARVAIGTFALGLGAVTLAGCAAQPPTLAWVAWLAASTVGVGAGSVVRPSRTRSGP